MPETTTDGAPTTAQSHRLSTGSPGSESLHAAVIEGPDLGLAFLLPDRPLVLGKGDDVDVRLSDSAVSGRHLELRVQGGEVEAIDLKSTNGSFIGVQRIHHALLSPGTILKIGRTRILIHRAPQPGEDLQSSPTNDSSKPKFPLSFKSARAACIEEFERCFLAEALERNQGNLSRTALEIGLTRHYLRKLLRQHRLIAKRPPGRPPGRSA